MLKKILSILLVFATVIFIAYSIGRIIQAFSTIFLVMSGGETSNFFIFAIGFVFLIILILVINLLFLIYTILSGNIKNSWN